MVVGGLLGINLCVKMSNTKSEDANYITETGVYLTSSSTNNVPTNGIGGAIFSIKWDENAVHHLYFSYSPKGVYHRISSQKVFGEWVKLV